LRSNLLTASLIKRWRWFAAIGGYLGVSESLRKLAEFVELFCPHERTDGFLAAIPDGATAGLRAPALCVASHPGSLWKSALHAGNIKECEVAGLSEPLTERSLS